MYNAHRGMMPHQAPTNRLTELLEQIRVEFDTQAGSLGDSARERDQMGGLLNNALVQYSLTDCRWPVQNQIRELELIRDKIYQLEQQHISMKSEYVGSLGKHSRHPH